MSILSPIQIGDLELSNRVVMSPLTRLRASAGSVPTDLNAEYYAQRASAGLIITEATDVSAQATGYYGAPGCWNGEQVAGWRLVTRAVHARGGRIFLQIWHTGRISHPSLQPGGALPVSSSAIAPTGAAVTATGKQPFVTPRELRIDEIPDIVHQFEHAARNAREAGFDGVEIHGANGYLIDQFLRDGANHRTDAYGGSPLNRARLLYEVLEAVLGVWNSERVGLRLSPLGASSSMSDSDPAGTFRVVTAGLNRFDLGFLELRLPTVGDDGAAGRGLLPLLRDTFRGPLILNDGLTFEAANAAIAAGETDLVSFGRPFISNPDLVERFKVGAPLSAGNPATYYGGGAEGYVDYPRAAAAAIAQVTA
jgi:N-ethylmaleimide reductase